MAPGSPRAKSRYGGSRLLKLLFIAFAIFPALTGFSLQYALRKSGAPDHRDSLIMAPVFFALAVASSWRGARWAKQSPPDFARVIRLSLAGGIALGIVLFAMGMLGALS